MRRAFLLGLALLLTVPLAAMPLPARAATSDSDVVVYGATPGGIMAALTAARAGVKVTLIEPSRHVGGIMSSGLVYTDIGDQSTLGGFTEEFFDRVAQIEGSVWGKFHFEPHVAEAVFEQMLSSAGVAVVTGQSLRPDSAVRSGARVVSIQTTDGTTHTGSVFVDTTYEGDLMAATGVSYRLGREGATEYGEGLAGVRDAQTVVAVPADTSPGPVSAPPNGSTGSADDRIQDSNYRLCFSSDPDNQVAFTQPAGYDPDDYAVVATYIQARAASGQTPRLSWVLTLSGTVKDKFDVNGAGPLSLALPGANWGWPAGDAAARDAMAAEHTNWDEGFIYFLRHDPRVPAEVSDELAQYGLCRDEYVDNAHWPWQLYLREGRRMVGAYVMTQRDVSTERTKADIIGVGSYRVDSHPVSRWFSTSDRRLRTEGWLSLPYRTYAIPYRAIVPQCSEATNLLVPVAASFSHVAHASFRMEPHYMLAGEAAGQAAAIVVGVGGAVQDVSIDALQAALRAHGSFLHNPGTRSLADRTGSLISLAAPFTDIADSKFRLDILWLARSGITAGCSDGRFCPDARVTRGQMAAFLDRALHLPATSTDFFTDDEESIFEGAINRLAASRITGGCSATAFCPRSDIARGQMSAFLDRALQLPPTPTDYFTDDETSIFEASINRLAASGITSGCSATRFCADAFVTRGQMAAFLHRALTRGSG
jgi:FAD dependent oxidoreductase/S-layer homology domain